MRGIPGACGTHEQMKLGISRFRDASLVKGERPLTVEEEYTVPGRWAGCGKSYR